MRRLAPTSGRPLLRPSLLGLLALVLAMAGCSSPFQRDIGEVVSGGSLHLLDGADWKVLEPGAAVPERATLRTEGSDARMTVGAGEVWLGPGATAEVTADGVDLLRGEVLVRSPDGALATAWKGVAVSGPATYRLRAGAAPRVGVYEGVAQIRRAGESREVRGLREVGLAVRRMPAGSPLLYHPDDEWDQTLLDGAVAFDREVERLRRGIDRRYGTDPQDAEFYDTFAAVSETIVPRLAAASRTVLPDDRFGPPSDALITLFVAQSAADGGDDLGVWTDRVARLRRAGARWGLIAEELDLTATRLARSVDLGEERRVAVAAEEESAAADASAPSGEDALGVPASGAAAASASGGGGSSGGGSSGGATDPVAGSEGQRGDSDSGDSGDADALPPLPEPIPSPPPAPESPEAPEAPEAPTPGRSEERSINAVTDNAMRPADAGQGHKEDGGKVEKNAAPDTPAGGGR